MSDKQTNENAMILTPRQERLQRVRDEMAPGEKPAAIVPRTFAEVLTMCQALASADLAPKALRGKATDMALVIMTGMEVGLPPMASLRLYTTWDGVPRLMAEGMRAIIIAHPECEWFRRVRGSDTEVVWSTKRRGMPEQQCTWTIERARQADLLGKDNWRKYKEQMLDARCSMQLAKLEWPDVVAGMISLEEARDGDFIDAQGTEAGPQFVAPPPPPAGPPPGVPQTLVAGGGRGGSSSGESSVAIGTPTEPRRGPGRPPGSGKKDSQSQTPGTDPFRAAREAVDARAAERPTAPAAGVSRDPSPPTIVPQQTASSSISESSPSSSPASSSVEHDRWGQSIGDPTSGGGSSASETSSASSETTSAASTDGFGGEDPVDTVDTAATPTGDPGLVLIADLQAFLAKCESQTQMQQGRPPFAQRAADLFKGGDARFASPGNGKPAGELAARMGQLWAERKTKVPV